MKRAPAVLALFMILSSCMPSLPPSPIIPPPSADKCVGTQGYAASFGGRRTFLWRPAWLNLIKAHDSAQALRDRIVARAEAALAGAAPSVMDKTGTPPSGDKHDFLSWPMYWWSVGPKDPSGPEAYEARDGQVNPERTSRRFDSSSFAEMRSRVVTLSLGHFLTGDRRYSRKASELLAAWFVDPATAMNPNLDFSQAVPGKRAPFAIDGIGLVQVIEAIGLLEASGDLAPDTQRGLETWFSRYVDWLTGPRSPQDRGAANNIALSYDLQLVEAALFSGRIDVARSVIQALPQERLMKQVAADGSLPLEVVRANGLTYSLFTLQMMFQLADLGACVDVDLWSIPENGAGIRAALDFLVPFIGREDKWPYPQAKRSPDDIRQLREAFRRLLAQAAWIYHEPRYLADAAALDADRSNADQVWWLGLMGLPELAPPDPSGD
jgi:hypothetical protein